MWHVVLCGLRVPETPNDPLGPEQSGRRPRWRGCPAQLGQLLLGSRAVVQNVVGRLARREAAARAEMAQRFLDDCTFREILRVRRPSAVGGGRAADISGFGRAPRQRRDIPPAAPRAATPAAGRRATAGGGGRPTARRRGRSSGRVGGPRPTPPPGCVATG